MPTLTQGRAVMALAALVAYGVSDTRADDQTENTQLAEAPVIEEIVVTASPIASDQGKLATIVGQVDRADILESGGATLADALTNVPGVTGSGFAAGASRPVIRGFDANRVRLLENGIGSFDVSDVGPDHGVPIDPLALKKIEVIRGAATLRYGSQAIGGVVNAIDNRIPLDLPDAPVTGDASASFATAANTRQGSALLDARAGQFAIHADVLGRKTDDYAIPSGTQSNSFSRAEGVSLGSSYFFGDNRAGAAIIHYDSRYGIPAEDAFIDMKQTKGLFGSSFAFENGVLEKLTVDAGYADYVHSEKEPDGTIGSTFKDKEWDARAELVFDEIGALSSAAVGTQFQGRKFSALGEGAEYLLPTDTDTAAGFAFAEAPLSDTIALQVGARVEHVSVTGTPVSGVLTQRSYTPISGSAGLVFNPTDMLTFGLTASSAARAPAQTELFSRGPHDGPQTYEIGDPTLHTERANSAEATLHFNDERLHLEGALWVTKFNRYIFGNLTGQVCDEDGICGNDPDAELKEMFYAQRDATFRGFEASATFTLVDSPSGTLDLETLADYVRATFDGNGGNVPRIPPYHIGGGVSWASDSFDASVLLKYAGKQTKTGAAETETRGFADLRAQIAWRPFAARPGVEFAIVGKNLTNETQRNATALNKDEVIQPGRDVRFMVRTSF